jgi:hypothetical protein
MVEARSGKGPRYLIKFVVFRSPLILREKRSGREQFPTGLEPVCRT